MELLPIIFRDFISTGAKLLTDQEEWLKRVNNVRAFIFDWDGVFNEGIKSPQLPSPFSEPDSMGVNLLRYGYWIKNGQQLPPTAIITGATNETAQYFAQREHFHSIFFGFKDKTVALRKFCEDHSLKPQEIAFVFDDVLDLSLAKVVGLRVLVKRTGNPLFNTYVNEKGLCEYMTAHSGGNYAVREICELLLGSYGLYNQVVDSRIQFDKPYQKYWKARNAVKTRLIDFESVI